MGASATGRGAPRRHRSRARAWILHIHYQWESGGRRGTLAQALEHTLERRHVAEERLPYVRRILESLDSHGAEIDGAVQETLENWRMERLSAIDRGILRLAAAEMFYHEDVPPKVSIQEAIHLAERYGGAESARFVNGVLDALYKGARPAP